MATYAGTVTTLSGLHAGRYDYFHGVGNGVVAGTVRTKATPADLPTSCLVRLFRDQDGLFIKATWSDATTGAFSFSSLAMDYTYTAMAVDHTNNFRAVVADRVAPIEGTP